MSKIIEASEQELNVLAGMIDLAVKSAGLQVAENAVFWLKKLENAQDAEGAPQPTE